MNKYLDAFLVLGYVLSPVVAYFVYWIWKRVRGVGGKDAEGDGAEAEA